MRRRGNLRSRKGCLNCRKRKVKCDETQPTCTQCQRSGRSCSTIDSLFRPHTFSLPGAPDPGVQERERTTAAPAGGSTSIAWARVDRQVDIPTTLNTVPEALQQSPGSTQLESATSSPSRLSYHDGSYVIPLDLLSGPSRHESVAGSHRDGVLQPLPRNGQHRSELRGPGTPTYTTASIGNNLRPLQSPEVNEDDETAWFLRHYSEGLAKAMDIIDLKHYFSSDVMVLARVSPLIKYSACAVAAKQLGQMQDPHSHVQPTSANVLVMTDLESTGFDYLWYGAKYYEKAIQLLAELLHSDPASFFPSPNESNWAIGTSETEVDMRTMDEDDPRFDLVAACIMAQYEHLSATRKAWSGHINGVYRLLGVQELEINHHSPQTSHTEYPPCDLKAGVQPIFWYFVLNDFENSFIARKRTRADPDNIPLWRSMGLPLLNEGSPVGESEEGITNWTKEELAIRLLLRLLCKLVNAMARPVLPNLEATSTAGSIAANESLWADLSHQFDDWASSLPLSFQPSSILRRERDGRRTHSEIFAGETWFSNNICATAMMFYHMARMLILIQSPIALTQTRNPGINTHFDLLHAYRAVQRELSDHARRIVWMALGKPDDCVMVHMVQPLYVAGRCLTESADRHALLDTLKYIETRLGITTEYRVNELLGEWGMDAASEPAV